jgi:hypothetical protein
VEHSALISSLAVSVAISFVSLSNTLLAVNLFSRIPANMVVQFFSHNTIFIFIGHMPLYEVAEPIAIVFVENGWGKRAIIVFIMYVGLALLSVIMHTMINLGQLKTALWLKVKRVKPPQVFGAVLPNNLFLLTSIPHRLRQTIFDYMRQLFSKFVTNVVTVGISNNTIAISWANFIKAILC